jgi:hypothetical protein
MRLLTLLTLTASVTLLQTGAGRAQEGTALQTQLEALERRIEQAQEAWERAYSRIDQFSMADMPKWNALVDARSRELDRLRDERARLAQKASEVYAARADQVNAQINQFKGANLVAGSNIDFLNNVARYPKREDFEKNREQMSQDWERKYGSALKKHSQTEMEKKIDEGFKEWFPEGKDTGYRRIGTINPYTGEYYYKFYDKDGEWKFSVWNTGYEGWKRYQDDLKAEWRRHSLSREEYLRQAKGLKDKLDGLADAEKKAGDQLSRAKGQLASLARQAREDEAERARAQVVGTWKGVSVQGDNRVSVTAYFSDDGRVTNTGSNGKSGRGTWIRDGDSIRVTWSTGAIVSFRIQGNQITGSGMTSRGEPWSVSLGKQ